MANRNRARVVMLCNRGLMRSRTPNDIVHQRAELLGCDVRTVFRLAFLMSGDQSASSIIPFQEYCRVKDRPPVHPVVLAFCTTSLRCHVCSRILTSRVRFTRAPMREKLRYYCSEAHFAADT